VIRRFAALVLAPVVLAGLALGASRAAATEDRDAAAFVAKMNAVRQEHGLRPYAVATDLATVARRHSQEMAAKQSLYHNKNLGTEVGNWQVVGENVGDGGSVDSLHTAFMNSPEHRANILAKDYTQVGIGTVRDSNGVLWVTEVFRLPYRAPVVTAPTSTTRATRPAPRAVAPRPVVKAAARTVAKPAARKAVAVPLRPTAGAFLTALAPAGGDPLSQALTYADAMAALTR
jgi:hypothetical protein